VTQGTGRTPSWRACGAKVVLALALAGSLAACSPAAVRTSSAPAEPSIAFPDAASAAIPGGVFVDTSRLAQVQPGLARSQVYALLGIPHFREGMDAPQWNYVFNYRDDAGQVQQCQFLVMFNVDDRVAGMHWQPDGCQARLLARATQTPPMATWQPASPAVATPAAPRTVNAPSAAAPSSVTAPANTREPAPSVPVPASDGALAATGQESAPSRAAAVVTVPAPASAVPSPTAPGPLISNAPEPSAALLPIPTVTLSNDEAFGAGSAKLTRAGRERLDMMLLTVQVPTQFHDLHVVGFSDRIGTAKNNRRLSQIRAEAVRKYLVEGGVPADVVTATGKGEQDPVAECDKKKGAALTQCLAPNRRIEINGTAPADAISR
jgi:outer membrane protein OmpA-like peptidoglycan-associated protein